MYGPLEGGGVFVWSLSTGVVWGTGAANIRPSSLTNVPLGLSSWIVIWPLWSLAWIPLIVSAFPFA